MRAPGAEDGLEVRDVVVRYRASRARDRAARDTVAVDGVSLHVAPGEIVALLGPSGCGKSSLLRAVAGLEPLAAGEVRFDGQDLAGVPVHRRRFGLMFQDGQLFPHRDVTRNVAYGLEASGTAGSERGARVAELLDAVGLAGYGSRAVTTLSGGERQRVALARALAPRPRLLLLDEPLSALDRGLRERLASELREVLTATGTTAVFVTHDHDEAFVVADRVAVMDRGRLLQVAPPEELWRAPASRRVAEFLGFQAFVPAAALPPGVLPDAGRPSRADLSPETVVAVGPAGLRLLPDIGEPLRAVEQGPLWQASVVGTAFRRGRAEVTVDVDLGSGPVRVVAVEEPALYDGVAADPAGRRRRPAVGEKVTIVLDPSGCALLPALR
ncbi:ABC transporter ATP-binding protein [Antribacter gilvus]|uniref:ABC transporter ATP-binding protein n=1 Tax=Antribacter gilvus TaxID=2304675 RepID=UPI000F79A434|nr:ABC transporter ATP-binding protein [Antribacter gilvus]